MNNIQPVGSKILVKPIKRKEDKLDSGIIIPGTANAELSEAEVVAVSAELSKVYKVGDIVLFPSKAGVGFAVGNVPHLWLNCDPMGAAEVWGILNQKIAIDNEDNL